MARLTQTNTQTHKQIGMARTICVYIRCTYSSFGRNFTKCMVYGCVRCIYTIYGPGQSYKLTYRHAHAHAQTHTLTNTHTHKNILTHMHTYAHTHTHTHNHKHTHANTPWAFACLQARLMHFIHCLPCSFPIIVMSILVTWCLCARMCSGMGGWVGGYISKQYWDISRSILKQINTGTSADQYWDRSILGQINTGTSADQYWGRSILGHQQINTEADQYWDISRSILGQINTGTSADQYWGRSIL